MILIAPPSPHASSGVNPAERDRVADAFNDGKVNALAASLLHEVRRSLEDGGVRGLISAAIYTAANGVTNNGRGQSLDQVETADVAMALELMIAEAKNAREGERARQQAHKQAQRAAEAEWTEVVCAVNERWSHAKSRLAALTERQDVLRRGFSIPGDQRFEIQMQALRSTGLDEMQARELLQEATGAMKAAPQASREELNRQAAETNALITRFTAFSADRRANFWQIYDIDATLDAMLEATAARLGIAAPETPIEARAA